MIIFTNNTFNISICLKKCCFVRSESCFYADIGRLPNLFIQPVNFCACHTIVFSQRINDTIKSKFNRKLKGCIVVVANDHTFSTLLFIH